MKDVVIIGGGITGLSVAWRLINKGFKVKILEMDERVGGLAKSIKIEINIKQNNVQTKKRNYHGQIY